MKLFSVYYPSQPVAVVPIDTRLDIPNKGGLRTPEEIESLIARMDMVVTTRLHGMVLSLKNGVPVLAVDPITGGAKITRQANVIGWSNTLIIDNLDNENLLIGYRYCFTIDAKEKAKECKEEATKKLNNHEDILINFLKG